MIELNLLHTIKFVHHMLEKS